MNATELYKSGKLDEAIAALVDSVRRNPTDSRSRTFLFELLCFAGELDRAEKHLDVLASSGREAEVGALVYRSALHAERLRRGVFSANGMPPSTAAPRAVSGQLNGNPFDSLEDADPRIGARLEIFAAGQYTWLPFEQVEQIRMEPPKRLRDLLWAPARVRTGSRFQGMELGEVLVPVLTPEAHRSPDPSIRLGRITDWMSLDNGSEVPIGQKLLNVDGEGVPILEVRELVITGVRED
jgi:type VI secretion system protein ImpE